MTYRQNGTKHALRLLEKKRLEYLAYILLGVIAGLIAGLMGLGGGVIVVPALIFMFDYLSFNETVLTQMAVATSLATIIISTGSSTRVHFKKKAIHWGLFRYMGPCVLAGSLAGTQTAHLVQGPTLQLFCGIFNISIGIKMFLNLRAKTGEFKADPKIQSIAGTIIGTLSGMLGIGGGAITVPWLSWCGLKLQQAMATASLLGLTLSTAGTVGYIWAGRDISGTPAWSLGYIYLPAFIGITCTSFFFARLGARWAHRIKGHYLRQLFSAVLILIGIKFIFSWYSNQIASEAAKDYVWFGVGTVTFAVVYSLLRLGARRF